MIEMKRKVRIACVQMDVVYGDISGTIAKVTQWVEKAAEEHADVALFPELVLSAGYALGERYKSVAETIPGPSTEIIAKLAREKKLNIIIGIAEKTKSGVLHDSAVFFDRRGQNLGIYRKSHTYPPTESIFERGNELPIIHTDFGPVGLLICYDLEFPETARILALQGAEIILMPIWAGSELLEKARAYENHLFLVTSSYDEHTEIIDPNGEVVVKSPQLGTPAITTIDLNRRYVDPWLGDMRGRLVKEIRLHVGNPGQTPDCTPELRQWK